MFNLKSIWNAWNKFFFDTRPTEGIALFRIVWMSLIFVYFLLDLNNVKDFYGPHAIISLSTVRDQFPYHYLNIFQYFYPSYDDIYALLAIYGVAIAFSIVGLFTRQSLIIALICMLSFHQRNLWLLSSSEVLMRSITLLLIFSPCGHSLSIDAFLGRYLEWFKKDRMWSIWALRLIQIQISVVYLWTVWHKLKGESWFDGSAVYYATRLEGLANFTIPFLMDSPIFLKIATWSTLLIEIALGALIWTKEFRRPVILVGIAFHLGIEYIMSIPFFELYMIALLLNFYTPEEHLAFIEKVKLAIIQRVQSMKIEPTVDEKIIPAIEK